MPNHTCLLRSGGALAPEKPVRRQAASGRCAVCFAEVGWADYDYEQDYDCESIIIVIIILILIRFTIHGLT